MTPLANFLIQKLGVPHDLINSLSRLTTPFTRRWQPFGLTNQLYTVGVQRDCYAVIARSLKLLDSYNSP